jgi:sugar phosphate isomerase/epimerase
MRKHNKFTRRSFLALAAAAPLGALASSSKHIPIGLELYSVRNDLEKDLMGTVRKVAKMGYECVEFYSPYYQWTTDYAKQVRKELDNLGIRCHSTHNDSNSFTPNGIGKAIELNRILGSRNIVMAHPGEVSSLDQWKQVADTLNKASQILAKEGMRAGYHNHDAEWKLVDGKMPLELLAANTDKNVKLQLDVGTCLETGNDPVAWIEKNPGRIGSMHCKEWSPQKGYSVLLGEGSGQWKKIFAAAEQKGGIEFYLIEQEGSEYSEEETARRCLAAYRKLRA